MGDFEQVNNAPTKEQAEPYSKGGLLEILKYHGVDTINVSDKPTLDDRINVAMAIRMKDPYLAAELSMGRRIDSTEPSAMDIHFGKNEIQSPDESVARDFLYGFTGRPRVRIPKNKAVSSQEKFNETGFQNIYHLGKGEMYQGDAEYIILVWNDNNIIPADVYRKVNYPGEVVDIVVCEDPNVQKKQLGERAMVYNYAV